MTRGEEVHQRDGCSRGCERCLGKRGCEGEEGRRAFGGGRGGTGMLVLLCGSSRDLLREGGGGEYHQCVSTRLREGRGV